MSIRLEDYIEGLEVLADELAGAGDRGNADFLSDVECFAIVWFCLVFLLAMV